MTIFFANIERRHSASARHQRRRAGQHQMPSEFRVRTGSTPSEQRRRDEKRAEATHMGGLGSLR